MNTFNAFSIAIFQVFPLGRGSIFIFSSWIRFQLQPYFSGLWIRIQFFAHLYSVLQNCGVKNNYEEFAVIDPYTDSWVSVSFFIFFKNTNTKSLIPRFHHNYYLFHASFPLVSGTRRENECGSMRMRIWIKARLLPHSLH